MPSFLLDSSNTGTGVRGDMGSDIFAATLVAYQAYQLSTDSNAIFGGGDFQRVTVQGYVMSVGNAGVQLSGLGAFISISETGIVANSGTDLQAAVRTFGIDARIINAGEISGGVGVGLFQGGNIVNSGTITAVGTTYNNDPEASAAIVLAATASTDMWITNTGLITGADIAIVDGTVSALFGGAGADVVAISGAVLAGVFLDEDADTLYLTGAGRAFDVAGGLGNDSLYGGQADDRLFGQDDDDSLAGSFGDDLLLGDAGADVVYGGDGGVDTLSGGAGDDVLNGNDQNDDARGGTGEDTIYGGNGLDTLYGRSDNDAVFGDAGNDSVFGWYGDDELSGGTGRDTLSGGAGADQFYFLTVAEAGNGALRDVIGDFQVRVDDIDLSFIDAKTAVAGNQAFAFIGAAAFTGTGQVRYVGGVLSGNVGGTLAADFAVAITGGLSLTVADLIL
jgi:Ca2+-binding RTX toxin-like protein